jgi:16S rRNA (cytidine1402-2'-O)-methyltransferase
VIVKLAHEKVFRSYHYWTFLYFISYDGLRNEWPKFYFSRLFTNRKDEKKASFKSLERISLKNQSQIFIETPYRNNKLLEDLIQTLNPETHLCIATDITLPTEYIKQKKIAAWKKETIDLHKRPTIFIIQNVNENALHQQREIKHVFNKLFFIDFLCLIIL